MLLIIKLQISFSFLFPPEMYLLKRRSELIFKHVPELQSPARFFIKIFPCNMFHCMVVRFYLLFTIQPGINKDSIASIFVRNNHFFSRYWKILKDNINDLISQYYHFPFALKQAPSGVTLLNLPEPSRAVRQIMPGVLYSQKFPVLLGRFRR